MTFRKPGGPFAIVARHVHIDGNDRYEYSERLYRIESDGIVALAGSRIWLEIGGLEGLDWRWLAGMNVCAVAAGWLPFFGRRIPAYAVAVLSLSAIFIAVVALRLDHPWRAAAMLTIGLFAAPSLVLLARRSFVLNQS
jgi:hypothetical protein